MDSGTSAIGASPQMPEADLLAAIGQQLILVYRDLLGQPPPPHIAALAVRLMATEAGVASIPQER